MTTTAVRRPSIGFRIWDRELDHYPKASVRFTSLGIVVVATIILYYQFYLAGAVAARIISDYHMSFVYYVNISVAGYLLGALASFLTGIADRYGRANIVTVGLFITGLLCLIGIPNVHSKLGFGIVFAAIGMVEGVILVATPALIRDFSPQLGRASAMGFWTLGPVMGSLVVSAAVSNTSDSMPWQDQYIASGIVGLVIAVVALFGLRELAPRLRDQLMVSSRDRALIEARAMGIDVEASLRHPFRQMLKTDIVGSAFAISFFLIIYYTAVGFFPIYFQTVFGFSQSKANALGNWNWTFNAIALVLVGVLSDRIRVRKPFMIVGAVGAIVFTVLFLSRATHPDTSYSTFVWLLIGLSVSLGVTYAPWMASFTETVERRNPALTATGLAVWGLIIRVVIALSVFIVPHIVTNVTTLVDKGTAVQAAVAGKDPALTPAQNAAVKAIAADPTIVSKVQSLATKYVTELQTAAKIDPATSVALAKDPTDLAAQAKALSEITGTDAATVTRVLTLSAKYGDDLKTAQAIDPATQAALLSNPTDQTLIAKAVGEIATALKISPTEALSRLEALATVPKSDLVFLATNAPSVQTAGASLQALAKVPPADLQFLEKYGTPLKDPKVVASLGALERNAPGVQKAQRDAPKQWQKYFWIAVGGQILFIPLIFLMAGYWSPRKARRAERQHEAWLAAEMAELAKRS